MTASRPLQRSFLLFVLSLLCSCFSVTIASASRSDVFRGRDTVRNDDGNTQTAHENGRHSTATSARIHSNRYGIIVVTIQVDIEEHKMMPIAFSSEKKDSEERALVRNTFDVRNSSVVSLRNNTDIIWTVSVEEIKVEESDVEREKSKLKSMPYYQRIFLEWNKTKEANEYVMEKSEDAASVNSTASNSLYHNQIHYSGTANCTFLVPLTRDDTSSSSSLSRTFIVSLMQATRVSLDTDTRYDSQGGNTYTVLTRRLAVLPRGSNSQRSIDPLANVFLYHSQRMSYHEVPQLFSKCNHSHSSNEERHVTGDGGDNSGKSDYTSWINLRNRLHDDKNFLWSMILFCIIYVIQSMPLPNLLKWEYFLRNVTSFGYVTSSLLSEEQYTEDWVDSFHCANNKDREDKVTIAIQKQNDENDGEACQDSMHCHHDELEGECVNGEDIVDKKGYLYGEKYHHHSQQLEEASSKENVVQANPRVQLGHFYSEESGKITLSESGSCFRNNHRERDRTEILENNEVECNIYDKTAEEEMRSRESKDDSLDLMLDKSRTMHEDAVLDDSMTSLRPSDELKVITSDISRFSDNTLKDTKPKSENVDKCFNSSKISVLPTVHHQDNPTNVEKPAITSTIGASYRNNTEPQMQQKDNFRKRAKILHRNDIQKKSTTSIESLASLDQPLKDAPRVTDCIANSVNTRKCLDHSCRKELPGKDARSMEKALTTGKDDGRLHLFKETCNNGGRGNSSDQPKNFCELSFVEAMDENLNDKKNSLTPLEFPFETSTETTNHMKSVLSTSSAHNTGIRPLHEDNEVFDNLLLKKCHQKNSITQGPVITIPTKNRMETSGAAIHSLSVDNQQLKLKHDEPSTQIVKANQFLRNGIHAKETWTSKSATKGPHIDMTREATEKKDQNHNNTMEIVGGHGNHTNTFLKNKNGVDDYRMHSVKGLSRGSQGIAILDAMDSDVEKKRLDQSNQDYPEISELEVNNDVSGNHILNTTDQHLGTIPGAEDGNPNQFQSIQKCEKDVSQEKDGSREIHGSETEESYVSTLPPDSDYVSDEDRFLMLPPGSRTEVQAVELQSTENRKIYEREKISTTSRRVRKRKRLSRYDEIHGEGTFTRDTKLLKDSLDETDISSVEVVRVTIPDSSSEKRVKRPYSKSNYVADWVPSNELQSISQDFFQDKSWDIVTPSKHTLGNTTRIQEKSKKNKNHPPPSSTTTTSF